MSHLHIYNFNLYSWIHSKRIQTECQSQGRAKHNQKARTRFPGISNESNIKLLIYRHGVLDINTLVRGEQKDINLVTCSRKSVKPNKIYLIENNYPTDKKALPKSF